MQGELKMIGRSAFLCLQWFVSLEVHVGLSEAEYLAHNESKAHKKNLCGQSNIEANISVNSLNELCANVIRMAVNGEEDAAKEDERVNQVENGDSESQSESHSDSDSGPETVKFDFASGGESDTQASNSSNYETAGESPLKVSRKESSNMSQSNQFMVRQIEDPGTQPNRSPKIHLEPPPNMQKGNHANAMILNAPATFLEKFFLDKNIGQSPKQTENLISEQLQELIRRSFESCFRKDAKGIDCVLYGSQTYGAASRESDLNIFVDYDNDYLTQRTKSIRSEKRERGLAALKLEPQTWSEISLPQITQFRCVLQATHKITSIRCSLSFDTGIPHITSKFIKSVFANFPMSKWSLLGMIFRLNNFGVVGRRMVFALKAWQNFIQNNDATKELFHFSTYTLTILVICFFQIEGILPSIDSLQKNNEQYQKIGGEWITGR